MLRYALLGRTGSGRQFFQQLLEKNGFKVAKSYTTRKPVDENDNSHYFIDNINDYENRILETKHYNTESCHDETYFYTHEQLETAQIIPIDPENLRALCEIFPDDAFRFIEVMASNEDRIKYAVADAEDKIITEENLITECESENDAFIEFEDKMRDGVLNIPNINMGHVAVNDFTDKSDLYGWIDNIKAAFREFERISVIVDELAENNILSRDTETGKITVFMVGKDGKEKITQESRDLFAESVITDNEGMARIMSAWLQLENTSFRKEENNDL